MEEEEAFKLSEQWQRWSSRVLQELQYKETQEPICDMETSVANKHCEGTNSNAHNSKIK